MCDVAAADAQALCLKCGLCCDGSLFTRVPLGENDAPPARAGVVTNERGARYLPQPCAALEGDLRCAVYAERPLACRRFECLLLVALADGETTLAGALELVRRARALLGEARVEKTPEAQRRAADFLRFNFGRFGEVRER